MHPSFVFTSFAVNQNVLTLPHTDSNNLGTEGNLLIPLTKFSGGEVWVETQDVTRGFGLEGQTSTRHAAQASRRT